MVRHARKLLREPFSETLTMARCGSVASLPAEAGSGGPSSVKIPPFLRVPTMTDLENDGNKTSAAPTTTVLMLPSGRKVHVAIAVPDPAGRLPDGWKARRGREHMFRDDVECIMLTLPDGVRVRAILAVEGTTEDAGHEWKELSVLMPTQTVVETTIEEHGIWANVRVTPANATSCKRVYEEHVDTTGLDFQFVATAPVECKRAVSVK
jgi:hypothetical protein